MSKKFRFALVDAFVDIKIMSMEQGWSMVGILMLRTSGSIPAWDTLDK
jgi:hypothetical protein